ncbi:MAG: hypothetical protein JRH20_29865 [Deltaproteobacteria bacterium]|nr:hypothetical protein [Deltaproteobacteria bacterium]
MGTATSDFPLSIEAMDIRANATVLAEVHALWRHRRLRLAFVCITVTLLLVLGVSFLLPNMLHLSDMLRLQGQLVWPSGWPTPWGYHATRPWSPADTSDCSPRHQLLLRRPHQAGGDGLGT